MRYVENEEETNNKETQRGRVEKNSPEEKMKATVKHRVITAVRYRGQGYTVSVSGSGVRISNIEMGKKRFTVTTWNKIHQMFFPEERGEKR